MKSISYIDAARTASNFRSAGSYEQVRQDQCRRWHAGERELVESYLARDLALADNSEGVLDLIYQELLLREERGESISIGEYRRRFPTQATELEHLLEVHRAIGDTQFEDSLLPGQTVAHYLVDRRLGSGGMGEVYLAQDTVLQRRVALKVLPRNYSPSLRARLLAEANAAASVQHPAIATFFDSGTAGGQTYIAMEYVAGSTLRDRLRSGPLPWRNSVSVVVCVLEALAHAHGDGVLHCDVKPENIMLVDERTAKLLDFGLAKRHLVSPAESQCRYNFGAATDAMLAGTPGYMAPEQLRNEPLDQRCDIFSTGVVLFEAITGQPAFPVSTSQQQLADILNSELAPVGDHSVPTLLVEILHTALQHDPRHRFRCTLDFLNALRCEELWHSEDVQGNDARTVKSEPNESYAHGMRQWQQMQKGTFQLAQVSYQQAIEQDVTHLPTLCGLAALHAMRFTYLTDPKELESASDYARRAITANPIQADAHSWLGYVLWRQGKLKLALQELSVAQSCDTKTDESLHFAPYFTGCIFMSLRRFREALAQLLRATDLNPSFPWSWAGLGWTQFELRDHDAALESMQQAIVMERQGSTTPTAGIEGVQGEMLRRSGRFSEARASCMRGLSIVEKSDHMYRDTLRGVCLCTLGRTALDQGDLPAAESAFHQAIAHLEGRHRALGGGHLLVQARAGLAQATGNRQLLDVAIELDSNREASSFHYFFTCADEITTVAIRQAIDALARQE